jgi:hypothetical protein
MLSGIRDHAVALDFIRYNLPSVQGRGIDQLPSEVVEQFESSLVCQLDVAKLSMRAPCRGTDTLSAGSATFLTSGLANGSNAIAASVWR